MKVVYNNDEQQDVHVRVNDSAFYDALNAGGDTSHFHVTLKPYELRVFTLNVPAGSVPYIKKWKSVVMISYIDPSGLAQFGQWPQPGEDG